MDNPVAALEGAIAYRFQDPDLPLRALTHRSWVAEHSFPEPDREDNERLEFLGDAVLGFLVSEALVLRFPQQREGQLSQLKAHLVSSAHLYGCAVDVRLGEFMQLGRGEELNGGRKRKTVLADAFESLIAAIYLDGGLEVTRDFIARHVLRSLDDPDAAGSLGLQNHKSLLQEKSQALGLPVPRYATIRTSGPEHAKEFTVEVRVKEGLTSRATASSKKAASQLAAAQLYDRMILSELASPGHKPDSRPV